jgi:peptidoglycan biosynthesis protein MviN/MurJ (putative lipid II flippase)
MTKPHLDRWLETIHGRAFVRKVGAEGSVDVDDEHYYISRACAGRYVVLFVNAPEKAFGVWLDGRLIKSVPIEGKMALHRHKRWGGNTFRFSLNSFRLGANVSLRRFSVTEGALLLMMAYLTSKGSGVKRQSLFNVLFSTGSDVNAYFSAFNLPDTLFNPIAGGALSSAFIPIFIGYEQRHGNGEAWRLVSLVFNVLLMGLTAVILVAELLASRFVNTLLVPGLPPYEKALPTTLMRIMLLHSLILGLGTVATAILNSKQRFLLPALSIAIYDFGLIGGLLVSAFCQAGVHIPGYAVSLPPLTADTLLILCFYALKDARTPLFTNIGMLVLHVILLATFVKVFYSRVSRLSWESY